MNQIEKHGAIYNIHPTYSTIASDRFSNIIDIKTFKHIRRWYHKGHYYVDFEFNGLHIKLSVHRFVYECFHGIIPEDKMVEHKYIHEIFNCIMPEWLINEKINQGYDYLSRLKLVPRTDEIEDMIIEIPDVIEINI